MQDQGRELTDLRNDSRRNREAEAQQQDVVMEWQTKLHDKEQDFNLIADKYEKKIKSLLADLEEKVSNLDASRETID